MEREGSSYSDGLVIPFGLSAECALAPPRGPVVPLQPGAFPCLRDKGRSGCAIGWRPLVPRVAQRSPLGSVGLLFPFKLLSDDFCIVVTNSSRWEFAREEKSVPALFRYPSLQQNESLCVSVAGQKEKQLPPHAAFLSDGGGSEAPTGMSSLWTKPGVRECWRVLVPDEGQCMLRFSSQICPHDSLPLLTFSHRHLSGFSHQLFLSVAAK